MKKPTDPPDTGTRAFTTGIEKTAAPPAPKSAPRSRVEARTQVDDLATGQTLATDTVPPMQTGGTRRPRSTGGGFGSLPPGATGEHRIGATLDPTRYRVGELLGAGAMGEVRVVEDNRVGRSVACKTLHGGGEAGAALRARFLREARVQGQLEHPSIVPVYDIVPGPDGELCFTMRRVKGQTLGSVIDGLAEDDARLKALFTRRKLLTAFISVCMAMDYAHAQGVVHRDLKPDNIMLGEYGEVYLLDWGVARVLGREAEVNAGLDLERTREGIIVGTPGYMSPEQFVGAQDEIGPPSDVYALGSILFELLTLQRLHEGTTLQDVAHSTMHGVDARPSVRDPGVGNALDDIVVKATALDPDERYKTPRALANAVERYLDGELDVERRKEMATTNASKARARLEDALRADAAPEQAEKARSEAMHSAVAALALDPDRSDAREVLARALLETPKYTPPEASKEFAVREAEVRKSGLRFLVLAMASFLLFAPATPLIGITNMTPIVGGFGMVSLCTLLGLFFYRTNRTSTGFASALGFLSALTIGLAACWMGPFVLVPTVVSVGATLYAMHSRKQERWIVPAVGMLSIVLPLAAELTGLVPPSMRFENGTVIFLPRALALGRNGVLWGLLYVHLSIIAVVTMTLGRIRDELTEAQRALFMHAWHLRALGNLGAK